MSATRQVSALTISPYACLTDDILPQLREIVGEEVAIVVLSSHTQVRAPSLADRVSTTMSLSIMNQMIK